MFNTKRLRAMLLQLAIAVTMTPAFSASVAPATADAYSFRACGASYAQDPMYDNGPFFSLYLPSLDHQGQITGITAVPSNEYTDQIEPLMENEGLYNVTLTLTRKLDYVAILEYAPFIYAVRYVSGSEHLNKPFTFVMVPEGVAIHDVVVKVVDASAKTVPGADVIFAAWSPDLDPYDMVTGNNGQLMLECIARPNRDLRPPFPNFLNIFVSVAQGSFCAFVPVPESQTVITVQVKFGGCTFNVPGIASPLTLPVHGR